MAASDTFVPDVQSPVIASRSVRSRTLASALVRTVSAMALPVSDFFVGALCTYFIYGHSTGPSLSGVQRGLVALIVVAPPLFARSQDGVSISNLGRILEVGIVLRSACQMVVILFWISLLLGRHLAVWMYLIFPLILSILGIGVRWVVNSTVRALHKRGYGADRVVIYGHSDTANYVASAILRAPLCGLHPVALICNEGLRCADAVYRFKHGLNKSIPIHDEPLTPATLNAVGCDLLIAAAPHLCAHDVAAIAEIGRQSGIAVAVATEVSENSRPLIGLNIDGLRFVSEPEMATARGDALKRLMDILIALLLLILGSPLLILIAAVIKLDTPGPVFFIQKRAGRNGELFDIYKFRSMHVSARSYEISPTEASDPRITRVGRILRRSGLDELPQLLNVLGGSMSLVGPRPEMPFLFERHVQRHRARLQVTPGVTGIWQLSADRAYPIHDNPQYDLFYIRHRNCFLDFAILLHTLLFAMRGGV